MNPPTFDLVSNADIFGAEMDDMNPPAALRRAMECMDQSAILYQEYEDVLSDLDHDDDVMTTTMKHTNDNVFPHETQHAPTAAAAAFALLREALDLRRHHVHRWNVLLLEVYARMLTLCIDMGNMEGAIEAGHAILAFYEEMYEPNHALMGLHLYTLGDVEHVASIARATSRRKKKKSGMETCESESHILHWREALRILTITHGESHALVQTLAARLGGVVPP
jgi:hypothetical protein